MFDVAKYCCERLRKYQFVIYIIFIPVPPLEVQIEEKKRALSAQKPVELVCRAGGSRPPANITWSIGHLPLKGTKEKISSEGNITTGKLTFIPTIEDRGKNITCRAENMLIPGSAIYDTWQVDVHCKYLLILKRSIIIDILCRWFQIM